MKKASVKWSIEMMVHLFKLTIEGRTCVDAMRLVLRQYNRSQKPNQRVSLLKGSSYIRYASSMVHALKQRYVSILNDKYHPDHFKAASMGLSAGIIAKNKN